ncbi:MAG: Glycogen synthase [Candidatus Anoxychlamydiales bacterium]|nr:Glycogen synthase [Candidatus Anoxychlamydiales bacterium]
MKIVNIAAELAPIAKVGGLGDVVGGLSSALIKEGQDVEVILPKYLNLNTKLLKDFKVYKRNFKIFEKRRWHSNTRYSARLISVKIYLIEDKKNYFAKPKIYGYKSDVNRFLYFCKAALEFLKSEGELIDILHLHDWHTAAIATFYKKIYSLEKKLKVKKIVLSIHNLKYQGHCKPKDIDNLGFDGRSLLKDDLLKDPFRPRTLNLLKGGFIFADKIIPVSENYAKEILSKENSYGLFKIVNKTKKKIKGIINGIDTIYWSAKTDKFIKYKYFEEQPLKKIIDAKKNNKKVLQKYLNLEEADKPLVCCIGRLVEQKGPDLIKHAILRSIKLNAQFVLLGAIFNKKIGRSFYNLQKALKGNKNIAIRFEHNEKLAHMLFAATDFVLVPSLFEPCGLTQMIGFRYGSIPIVRKTGGLADTVFDLDDKKILANKKNGFTFEKFSTSALDSAFTRAINFWYKNPNKCRSVMKKNMSLNFSWKKSANKYLKTYKNLLK